MTDKPELTAPESYPIKQFVGLQTFEPNDLTANFKNLMDAALIGRENQVASCIESFTIDGNETPVVEKKYKSALFVAYLTYLQHRMLADFHTGKPVEMSEYASGLVEEYFGKEFMDHDVPKALTKPGATIQVKWKQAA